MKRTSQWDWPNRWQAPRSRQGTEQATSRTSRLLYRMTSEPLFCNNNWTGILTTARAVIQKHESSRPAGIRLRVWQSVLSQPLCQVCIIPNSIDILAIVCIKTRRLNEHGWVLLGCVPSKISLRDSSPESLDNDTWNYELLLWNIRRSNVCVNGSSGNCGGTLVEQTPCENPPSQSPDHSPRISTPPLNTSLLVASKTHSPPPSYHVVVVPYRESPSPLVTAPV